MSEAVSSGVGGKGGVDGDMCNGTTINDSNCNGWKGCA